MNRFLLITFIWIAVNTIAQNKVPVAKFTFNDGTGKNEVGNNQAKIVGTSLVHDRFGNPRSACYLHGTYGSYINLGTDPSLKPVQATISMWFNMETKVVAGKGGEFNPLILTKSHGGNDFFEGYSIGYNWYAKRISAATTLSEEYQVNLRATDTTALNEWYHVVITYNDQFLALYINGELQNKLTKNFRSRFLASDSVMVGNSANEKNQRYFNGMVDDIEIYNEVLSEEDIKELYHAPNPSGNKWFLKTLIVLIVLIMCGLAAALYITRRSKAALESENANNKLLYRSYEQEIRTLKAQMDPHFIFNALNSIQKFIISNDNENAQLYLTKFSRLLRKMLESNEQENISLKDEIDLLNKYIEIESLRFESDFDQKISLAPDINPDVVFIPHMLIQPLVENAIWHGLLPKKGDKKLSVTFEMKDAKTLICKVSDNGVGRIKENEQKSLHKRPMALNFIRQRLDLMSKIHNTKFSLDVTDNMINGVSSGTTAIITLPAIQSHV